MKKQIKTKNAQVKEILERKFGIKTKKVVEVEYPKTHFRFMPLDGYNFYIDEYETMVVYSLCDAGFCD